MAPGGRRRKDIVNYGLYIALFPQLIAGPIIRYRDIADQLTARHVTVEDLTEGIGHLHRRPREEAAARQRARRLCRPGVSSRRRATCPLPARGSASSCYTGQIYFDFSGYSDMAIGLCRHVRLSHPQQLRLIRTSRSRSTEFWRRWHISLSNWFRDYLYIPLGGNRLGPRRTTDVNLLIVFLLCGLWHGAIGTSCSVGLYHGMFLILERLAPVQSDASARWDALLRHAYLLARRLRSGWGPVPRRQPRAGAKAYYGAMFRLQRRGRGRDPRRVRRARRGTLCGVARRRDARRVAGRTGDGRRWAQSERRDAARPTKIGGDCIRSPCLFGACRPSFVALGATQPVHLLPVLAPDA